MGEVVSLNPVSLEQFFEAMFGDNEGWVYSPTKDPNSATFEQYFYHWPNQKDRLIQHVERQTATNEVYFGPGLFSKPGAEKEDFKGTWYVWAEFDGTLPENLVGVPQPTIKLRSSTEGHEHWYWRLDRFVTDITVIEDISQRLAYYLGADLGCWNANRVLRPPGTLHHESGQHTILIRWSEESSPVEAFKDLPVLPVALVKDDDIGYIPQALDVIMKYQFSSDAAELFKCRLEDLHPDPNTGRPDRSAALTKLCHFGVEMGMNNAEILGILYNADERWGKFKDRPDRKRRLLGIINHCRSRHPVDPIEEEAKAAEHLRVYGYTEFAHTDLEIEWVIPGLIHKKGRVLISGPKGAGKSQFSFRMAEKLARGEKFLRWQPTRPMRVMFVSMEMPHEELKYITEGMAIGDDELLQENLLIMPVGFSIQLTKTGPQAEFARVIERYQPDGIIFDSLGVGIGGDLDSDRLVMATFNYVKRILCDQFGVFTWFIHHNRKAQIGNKRPDKLDDLFGSGYIGAEITTGINLWGNGGPTLEVSCLKMRMAKEFKKFNIRRTPNMDFELIQGIKEVASTGAVFANLDGDEGLMDTL